MLERRISKEVLSLIEAFHSIKWIEYKIEDISSLPKTKGVYMLTDNSRNPLYGGECVELRKRIMAHRRGTKDSKRFYKFIVRVFIFEIDIDNYERKALEGLLVTEYKPKYNTTDKKAKVNRSMNGRKVTRDICFAIWDGLANGVLQKTLAVTHGLDQATISYIKHKKQPRYQVYFKEYLKTKLG